jgi:hypothetical protein
VGFVGLEALAHRKQGVSALEELTRPSKMVLQFKNVGLKSMEYLEFRNQTVYDRFRRSNNRG